jgi:PhzF family phenazine biosynthesis protein
MAIPIYQVDAFVTDKKFSGNPAAVCLLETAADAGWMQNVGTEMNLAETAFLVRRAGDGYDLRWFTPEVEVDLCGHATLASAHVLWETQRLRAGEQARFHTKSGLLTADRKGEMIEMNFPATPEARAEAPAELIAALGVRPLYVGKNRFDYIVELESEEAVRAMVPDHLRLKNVPVRGVIVTSRSTSGGYDFISRFLAPGSGVPEDPATGSAHCCLGPYWQPKLGKSSFVAYQASSRGGIIHVRVEGERVVLAGRAETVLRGELASGPPGRA